MRPKPFATPARAYIKRNKERSDIIACRQDERLRVVAKQWVVASAAQ